MKNKPLIYFAVCFQCLIIAGLFGKALYPLLTGQEVYFKAYAYDPRDIFRGNYSNLRYDFSTIYLDSVKNDLDTNRRYTFGDVFFMELEKKDDFHFPVGLWTKKPEGKLAMKVYCDYAYRDYITLKGGIESYFTNPENALKIDEILANGRDSVVVMMTVMLADDGHARIKDLNFKTIQKKQEMPTDTGHVDKIVP